MSGAFGDTLTWAVSHITTFISVYYVTQVLFSECGKQIEMHGVFDPVCVLYICMHYNSSVSCVLECLTGNLPEKYVVSLVGMHYISCLLCIVKH